MPYLQKIKGIASQIHGRSSHQPLILSGSGAAKAADYLGADAEHLLRRVKSIAEAIEDIVIGIICAGILAGAFMLAGVAFGAAR